MKEAFFGDVSDEQADAAINLLQPDYPVVNGPIMTTAQRWGSIPRSYILTEQDKGVLPALQRRFIREVDEALPASKTDVRPINTSHSPFLLEASRTRENSDRTGSIELGIRRRSLRL